MLGRWLLVLAMVAAACGGRSAPGLVADAEPTADASGSAHPEVTTRFDVGVNADARVGENVDVDGVFDVAADLDVNAHAGADEDVDLVFDAVADAVDSDMDAGVQDLDLNAGLDVTDTADPDVDAGVGDLDLSASVDDLGDDSGVDEDVLDVDQDEGAGGDLVVDADVTADVDVDADGDTAPPDPCVVGCDDGDDCTLDFCLPDVGCDHWSLPSTCEDLDPCIVEDDCAFGSCALGWAEPAGTPCGEGDPCASSACDGSGACLPTGLDCDDDDACTLDACSADIGCVYTSLECEPVDACTAPACDSDLGCVSMPVDCGDGDACTADDCSPSVGCTHQLGSCDDSDACTKDTCVEGAGCEHQALTCDDGNSCTTDTCDPNVACVTTKVVCDPCQLNPGKYAGCPGVTNPCAWPVWAFQGKCGKLGGCYVVLAIDIDPCLSDALCADFNACTDDHCDPCGLFCENTLKSCADGDKCTVDDCNPASGECSHTPNTCKSWGPCDVVSCDPMLPGSGCAHAPLDCGTTAVCDPAVNGCVGPLPYPAHDAAHLAGVLAMPVDGATWIALDLDSPAAAPPCADDEAEYDGLCFATVDDVTGWTSAGYSVIASLPATADAASFAGMLADRYDGLHGYGRIADFVVAGESLDAVAAAVAIEQPTARVRRRVEGEPGVVVGALHTDHPGEAGDVVVFSPDPSSLCDAIATPGVVALVAPTGPFPECSDELPYTRLTLWAGPAGHRATSRGAPGLEPVASWRLLHDPTPGVHLIFECGDRLSLDATCQPALGPVGWAWDEPASDRVALFRCVAGDGDEIVATSCEAPIELLGYALP